jgi:hypothetical protein
MKSNSFFPLFYFMIKKLNKLNLTFVEPNSKLSIKEISLFLNKSIPKLNSFLINLTQKTCNTEFTTLKISEENKKKYLKIISQQNTKNFLNKNSFYFYKKNNLRGKKNDLIKNKIKIIYFKSIFINEMNHNSFLKIIIYIRIFF